MLHALVFAGNYSPFENITGDVSTLAEFDYTYRDPYPRAEAETQVHRKLLSSSSSTGGTDALPSEVPALDAGIQLGSPEAVAAVQRQLATWSNGYNGYTWQVQFRDMKKAIEGLNGTVQIHVLIKGVPGITALPAMGETVSPNTLRLRRDYCGSTAGWNDGVETFLNKTFSQSVDLTLCMRAAGFNPDTAPLDAADPGKGPSMAAVNVSDLSFTVLTSAGRVVAEESSWGKPVISWALPVEQQLSPTNMRLSRPAAAAVGLFSLKRGFF